MYRFLCVALVATIVSPSLAIGFRDRTDCVCRPSENAESTLTFAALQKPMLKNTERAPTLATISDAPAKVEKIEGNAAMPQDADTIYTVLALPKHYKTCRNCMAIKQAFESDAKLLDVRRQTKYVVLVEGDPQFDYKWAKAVPEVAAGQTCVVMLQGNKQLYRAASPKVGDLGVGLLDGLKKKLCPKVCPDCEPKPEPEETPQQPVTPVVNPEPQPAAEEKSTGTLAVVLALTAAAIMVVSQVKRRVF